MTNKQDPLIERLRIKASVMEMGECIAWGSDTALMREAADALALRDAQLEAVGAGGVSALMPGSRAQRHAGQETCHSQTPASAPQISLSRTDATQAGQEPVAWMAHYTNKSGLQCVYTSSSYALAVENDVNGAPVPLYTAPPATPMSEGCKLAPLTDREALMLAAQAGIKIKTGAGALKLIRAMEAHYGIHPSTKGATQ